MLVLWLGSALGVVLVDGLVRLGLGFGLVCGLFGLVCSHAGLTTVTWLQLQLSRQVPAISLMPFLEEARKRDVLRTVGAVYQFRHAKLQDQLSDGATTNNPPLAVQRPS